MNAIKSFFSEVFKRHTEDDAEEIVIVGAPGTIPAPETLSSKCPRPWLYTRVLAFFLLTTALLFLANILANPGQMTNVLVIGSFTAPFTILVLLFELNVFRNISFYTILKALFIGGALSLIVTAVLPSFWFQGITSVTDAFVAGIGEEVAKMLVVYWILKRNRAYPYILNGLLVGAAVGAGFAIFETAGYGMFSLLGGDNAWLGKESLTVLALRNLLAPGGHVVWAAISGAGILMAARREPLSTHVFRHKAFWAAFSAPVVLHVLWDAPFLKSVYGDLSFMATLTTLAWVIVAWFVRRGLEEIDTMRAIVPFRREFAAPSFPAGPWRRWAARLVDQLCGALLVMAVLARISEYFGFGDFFDNANQTIVGITLLPLLLLLEAIFYDLFGTTFGKWAFSIHVRDETGHVATSKAYFKRLARLWVSGFGLGLPIVSLITVAAQYRRLSSGKRASYDEKLCLHVDKGRIHPLRWLVVLPVLLIFSLIILAAVVADEEAPVAESGNPSLARMASSSGLKYEVGDTGYYNFTFYTDDEGGRAQTCFALPEVIDADGKECIFLGSIVASCDAVPTSALHEMLFANTARRDRLWGELENHLILRVLVPVGTSPEAFGQIVSDLASDADACEKELTGKDEF